MHVIAEIMMFFLFFIFSPFVYKSNTIVCNIDFVIHSLFCCYQKFFVILLQFDKHRISNCKTTFSNLFRQICKIYRLFYFARFYFTIPPPPMSSNFARFFMFFQKILQKKQPNAICQIVFVTHYLKKYAKCFGQSAVP